MSRNQDVNVFDVAAYILEIYGPTTELKLQKLVYYVQSWSLVWTGKPLFPEAIVAWKWGPVCKKLYDNDHDNDDRYPWIFEQSRGELDKLSPQTKKNIRSVVKFYGRWPAEWLVELTHREDPWKKTDIRKTISIELMKEYYSSLVCRKKVA